MCCRRGRRGASRWKYVLYLFSSQPFGLTRLEWAIRVSERGDWNSLLRFIRDGILIHYKKSFSSRSRWYCGTDSFDVSLCALGCAFLVSVHTGISLTVTDSFEGITQNDTFLTWIDSSGYTVRFGSFKIHNHVESARRSPICSVSCLHDLVDPPLNLYRWIILVCEQRCVISGYGHV